MNNKEIELINIGKYNSTERTEEVRDIIERMPTNFGSFISVIVGFIFLLLLVFGWIVRYPDVVHGITTVNTSVAPVKLFANASGKIHLNDIKSQSMTKAGAVVAYIETATSYDTLQYIKSVLKNYNPNNVENVSIIHQLPSTPALGELTSKYYNLIANLHQLALFHRDKLYDKQIASLQNLHGHQQKEVKNSLSLTEINKGALAFSQRSLARDSILFSQKVSSAAEYERAGQQYLSYSAGVASAQSNQIDAEKQAQKTRSDITQTRVQKSEKLAEIKIALLAAYNDLMDNISLWEERYVFKSPFEGQVQFLKFWTNSQYVQAGEAIFTIVPKAEEPYGQILLPAMGAGKVEVGQEAIIKLNDFPYNEYGSVKGVVRDISLTTSTEKTDQGSMEAYLVTVKFPSGLTTNYGKSIEFKHEAKGTAEIITKDRRLIERLFDNLKYALNK
ncbi:HlyD family secretion protein [Niabella sp. CJ426]|uniref:HlyD family secretion protein n=1 Tax=Niabella sp. CJ426 TaxID=3393740 RepID=UPI003D037D84